MWDFGSGGGRQIRWGSRIGSWKVNRVLEGKSGPGRQIGWGKANKVGIPDRVREGKSGGGIQNGLGSRIGSGKAKWVGEDK